MTELPTESSHVAVYFDHDNIVISRYDEIHGKKAWRNDKPNYTFRNKFIDRRVHDAHINVSAIMDYASSFGSIILSRAYADWSGRVNATYASEMLRHSVDLVQMFPLSSTKNGADIRLAIDVVDDLMRYPAITHVIIVAGDSDYMPLVQRCRRLGRRVIGIGAARSVGRYLGWSCDDYRFYSDLPSLSDVTQTVSLRAPAVSHDEAAEHPEVPAAGAASTAVVTLRRHLNIPVAAPPPSTWEACCVAAMHAAWDVLDTERELTHVPAERITTALDAAGFDRAGVKRAMGTVFGLLPVLVRDADLLLYPNPELRAMTDEQLTAQLRMAVATRLQLRAQPDQPDVEQICTAVFGEPPWPAGAVDTFSRALALPTGPLMDATVGAQLMSPAVLWDVAEVVCKLPDNAPYVTAQVLDEAMRPHLTELGRDLDPAELSAAYESLVDAEVLRPGPRGLQNTMHGREADEVAAQVIGRWARKLLDAGHLDPDESMTMEAFFRMTLQDRHQGQWRNFIRNIVSDCVVNGVD